MSFSKMVPILELKNLRSKRCTVNIYIFIADLSRRP